MSVVLEKELKIGDYEFTIKRYTFKERLMIQANALKGMENVDINNLKVDASKVNFIDFMVDSIYYGLKEAKYKGEKIQITKEFIENLDSEIANFLYLEIKNLNEKSFFLPQK
jgi:DNA polymerase elongation subunit (family B)